jgi:putative membrane-bound dehydrogenase-like protein
VTPLILAALLLFQDPVVQVPEGFVVEKVAGPPLVERPIMAGFDDKGRLYVADSSGVNLKITDLLKDPPHRVVRLEDADGDGTFDKSVVFADKMTFPMGALWYRGSLYVCAPPSVWKLTDKDGDGAADERVELVTKFGSTGNAADIHGPFLGPDGRLYWADGRHGHNIRRADGSVMEGKAARIFRSRPDGTDVEVVCGGGMDNPVEVAFTEEGEALVTAAIFHAQPRRVDSIFHAVWGGVFPYHDVVKEFKRTGDLLPSVVDVGWVAPSGLMRYRSDAFGREYVDSFFSAHFNTHKVQRHVIERDGATFRGRNEDFLVSPDPDFHPTDVLEDADGSLLVLDTGGWFRIGCPTSRIDKPQVKGAIYRVRRKGAPRPEDPRGLLIKTLSAEHLDDPRFAVRDAAVDFAPDASWLRQSRTPRGRRNAVWALTRLDGPEARAEVRTALEDKDAGVRQAAVHSAGLHRDPEALARLLEIVKDDVPPVRREAAAALGRIRDRKAVPALLEGLRAGGDRFLEHALVYALIEIGDPAGTRAGLRDPSPAVRRGALVALDQMDEGALTRDEVTPHLDPSNPALLQAALGIIVARPAWAGEILSLVREWLGREQPPEELQGVLAAFARDAAVQDLVAQALRSPRTSTALRLAALESVARAPLDRIPATWAAEARWSLDHADERVVRQAVAALRAAGVADFDEALLRIARDGARPDELRADALLAAAPRIARLEAGLFNFLLGCLDAEKPALLRLAAAQALGTAGCDDTQLGTLTISVAAAGALELPRLLGAFERCKNPTVGKRLVTGLEKSAVTESLPAEALRRALAGFPDEVRRQAEPILKRLDADLEKQKARLAELEPLLAGGDAARGREVFWGKKAACAACHAVGGQGGRVGPDLSKIGGIRGGRDLLEAIVFPSASFVRGFEPVLVRTKDGAVYDGLIARETADAIYLTLADRSEKRLARAAVGEFRQSRVSIMPQGLDAQLGRDELRDLLAYLQSLK